MTKIYSKGGKEVVVPHKIDVQGWLDAGYSKEDPKAKKPAGDANKADPMTADEFDANKDKLSTLSADEVKRAAAFAEVEYTNKDNTIAAIKDKLSL